MLLPGWSRVPIRLLISKRCVGRGNMVKVRRIQHFCTKQFAFMSGDLVGDHGKSGALFSLEYFTELVLRHSPSTLLPVIIKICGKFCSVRNPIFIWTPCLWSNVRGRRPDGIHTDMVDDYSHRLAAAPSIAQYDKRAN